MDFTSARIHNYTAPGRKRKKYMKKVDQEINANAITAITNAHILTESASLKTK